MVFLIRVPKANISKAELKDLVGKLPEPEPGRRLAFQQADDYNPPTWPGAERPQQFHIDLTVDDINVAEPAVLALGARKHDVQPGEAPGEAFRVYLDPVGHPFCLCWD